MAIVQLQRAWYRPKQPVIHYVSNQRVLVRARPAAVRNPRTKAQQANRSKMAIASAFLSPFQALVAHGFTSGTRPNGRPVGAYHMALGHLLNAAMVRERGQWGIDYARVELAEGLSLRPFPLRVNRDGRRLRLSWVEGLPEGTNRIRLAFHEAAGGQTVCLEVNAPSRGAFVEVLLPKWARSRALHMWWMPAVRGKTRWQSRYLLLPAGGKIVVGWLVGGRRLALLASSREGGVAAVGARVSGAESGSARAPGGFGGG